MNGNTLCGLCTAYVPACTRTGMCGCALQAIETQYWLLKSKPHIKKMFGMSTSARSWMTSVQLCLEYERVKDKQRKWKTKSDGGK